MRTVDNGGDSIIEAIEHKESRRRILCVLEVKLVGAPRFELGTSRTRTVRASRTALRPERLGL